MGIEEEIEKMAKVVKKLSEIPDNDNLAIPRTTLKAKKGKKLHRVTEPHLFPRNRKGHEYYFHTDGSHEEYIGTANNVLEFKRFYHALRHLGTADAILRKVKGRC